MATRVYPSGKNVIVSKTGTATLTILKERSKYTTIQTTSVVDGASVSVIDKILFADTYTLESRIDLISEIQDASGNKFDGLKSLQKYLLFIQRADSTFAAQEAATAANQTTIIAQNEDIKTNTLKIKEDTSVLDIIKDESKENNKILGKIYNHE